MANVSTFYYSRVLGNRIYNGDEDVLGKLIDLVVDVSFVRPKVIAAKAKIQGSIRLLDFSFFSIQKQKGQYLLICRELHDIALPQDNALYLGKNILDKQIVDMDGRKLERVNDIRLAVLSNGIYTVAVDVGIEGFLRRLGIAKPVKFLLKPLKLSVPTQMILWNEVATIDFSHQGLKLTRDYSKLSALHPSELADIIEELDRNTQVAIFTSLDEERAADVLEELDAEAQIHVLEGLSVEKAADMLEKMPADEVADILDELEDEQAEELLKEMERKASDEVRELMEYPENTVGSLMSTDFITFNENQTVSETFDELRRLKPEPDTIYYLYVLDDDEKLTAIVSIRDLVVSEPDVKLKDIMYTKVIYVFDTDKIDIIADTISKYNLLALPVVDKDNIMVGMVLIDDVVRTLLKNKRRWA